MIEEIVCNSGRLIKDGADRYKLTRTISAINAGFKDQESGLVIGQCKALIESLCKSILFSFHALRGNQWKSLYTAPSGCKSTNRACL